MTRFIEDYWNILMREAVALKHAFNGSFAEILESIIVYSFAMSILWTLTSLVYLFRSSRQASPIGGHASRGFTVLIPFFGEPLAALRSAQSLAGVVPQPDEIILIDDGSPHGLGSDVVLPANARVLTLQQRRGKAGALNEAILSVRSEIVVCIDADTQVRTSDWHPMLANFDDPNLGAITGKIWPVVQGGLINRFQRLDYLAVISVIKAAETVWGGLLTVSGAFVAYRRDAIHKVGGWREDKAAEDIDISWRMQCAGWRLGYDSSWACAVEMAQTFTALWRQRRRWSSGLGQALKDNGPRALICGARHLPVVVVSIANLIWIAAILVVTGATAYGLVFGKFGAGDWPPAGDVLLAGLVGLTLFSIQFLAATRIDGRTWRETIGLIPILPLYPLYFWSVLVTSFMAGFPRGMMRQGLGIWQPTVRKNAIEQKGLPA